VAGVGAQRQDHGVRDGGEHQSGHDLDVEVPEFSGDLAVAEDLLEGGLVGFLLRSV
jgi:hypothetical protein